MQDAFGVDREGVSKGALKTILFGSQKVKKPPKPPTISRLTGQQIKFNPRSATKVQYAKWGKNPLTGKSAVQRAAAANTRRRARLAQNTPLIPRSAPIGPPAPPKPWYKKRSNQAMMVGGAAAIGGAGYMGYRRSGNASGQ